VQAEVALRFAEISVILAKSPALVSGDTETFQIKLARADIGRCIEILGAGNVELVKAMEIQSAATTYAFVAFRFATAQVEELLTTLERNFLLQLEGSQLYPAEMIADEALIMRIKEQLVGSHGHVQIARHMLSMATAYRMNVDRRIPGAFDGPHQHPVRLERINSALELERMAQRIESRSRSTSSMTTNCLFAFDYGSV